MADKRHGNPFAMGFTEHDREFYFRTPEATRVSKAFAAALETLGSAGADPRSSGPRTAMRQFFEAFTAQEPLLGFASSLVADWLTDSVQPRAHRALLLTLLVRGGVDDDTERKAPIREREVGQGAQVVAGIIAQLPLDRIPTIVEWAADMSSGVTAGKDGPVIVAPQPTSVIRGVLFSHWLVRKEVFDLPRASAFWHAAMAEPHFPWKIFHDPCRAARGAIFTEAHQKTIGIILSVAPEDAARLICGRMIERARDKRVERMVTITDSKGTYLTEDVTEATPQERKTVFVGIAGGVSDSVHAGRKELVRELFRPILG